MSSIKTQHISLADYYFGFLKNLNHESKLDLIAKLSQSMKEDISEKEVSLKDLFGAYQSKESADEIITEIRSSRSFNRHTESF